MERKASAQEQLPAAGIDKSQSADSEEVMGVRIAKNETVATSGISFALMMDTDMCQRIVRELKSASNRINDILSEMGNYRLDWDLCTLVIENRSKLSRFSIVRSDCRWTELDSDLSAALERLEECHDILIRKYKDELRLSDLLSMIRVLENVREVFERKVEQIEEILR